MSAKLAAMFALVAVAASLVEGNPSIVTGYDHLELCIENCAQCKKTLGAWFEGPLCADSCLKFRGKLIPDCEDLTSIAPFLTKI